MSQKNVCRFCLEQDASKLGDIFSKSEESGRMPLAVQVMSCVSIEIFEGDGMPRVCCHICRKLMEVMHQYKQICRKSDVALKQCMMTGKLPSMFDLPVDLIKECLPKEKKTDRGTNTEERSNSATKAIQTESENLFKIPKPIVVPPIPAEPILSKSLTVVLDEVIIESPQDFKPTAPKQRRMEEKEIDMNEQIEILELTQSEVEKLQPELTQITHDNKNSNHVREKKKKKSKPLLLNKIYDKEKTSKPLIEFQKFHLTDNGDFQVEILEAIHDTGDNPVFSCDFCPRTFMIKQQLDLHLDTHFKERNFSCDICESKFLSRNDLAKHLQTHSSQKAHT